MLICLSLSLVIINTSGFIFVDVNRSVTSYFLQASKNRVDRKKKEELVKLETQEDLDKFLGAAKVLHLPQTIIETYTSKFVPPDPNKEATTKKEKVVVERKPKTLPKRLKKHEDILPEKNVEYPIDDAISRIKIISGCRFVEGIDLAIRIPVTTKKEKSTAGQYAKLVTIPYPSLRSKRSKIGVFAIDDTVEHIKTLDIPNLSFVGGIELIESIKNSGELPDVNLVISDVKTFHKLSLIGKLLGKRGLMPSIAVGTCLETKTDILEVLNNFTEKNIFVLKSEKTGDLKCSIADVSMPTEQIRTNLLEVINFLRKNKPPYSSHKFISKVFISSSMGPSFKLNLKQIGSTKSNKIY